MQINFQHKFSVFFPEFYGKHQCASFCKANFYACETAAITAEMYLCAVLFGIQP